MVTNTKIVIVTVAIIAIVLFFAYQSKAEEKKQPVFNSVDTMFENAVIEFCHNAIAPHKNMKDSDMYYYIRTYGNVDGGHALIDRIYEGASQIQKPRYPVDAYDWKKLLEPPIKATMFMAETLFKDTNAPFFDVNAFINNLKTGVSIAAMFV